MTTTTAFNVGDRVRVSPSPFYRVSSGETVGLGMHGWVDGGEGSVTKGADVDGDYRVQLDGLRLAQRVSPDCLTLVEPEPYQFTGGDRVVVSPQPYAHSGGGSTDPIYGWREGVKGEVLRGELSNYGNLAVRPESTGAWNWVAPECLTLLEAAEPIRPEPEPAHQALPFYQVDLENYKAKVRAALIREAEARGWCDELDGFLKELDLKPRTRHFRISFVVDDHRDEQAVRDYWHADSRNGFEIEEVEHV